MGIRGIANQNKPKKGNEKKEKKNQRVSYYELCLL